jgi:hypothetical protein
MLHAWIGCDKENFAENEVKRPARRFWTYTEGNKNYLKIICNVG